MVIYIYIQFLEEKKETGRFNNTWKKRIGHQKKTPEFGFNYSTLYI